MKEVQFPEPDPPFMVQDTFEIKADVFPLGSVLNGRREHQHFVEDSRFWEDLAGKLSVLSSHPAQHRVVCTQDPTGLSRTLWEVFRVYASEHPELLEWTPQRVHHRGLGLTFLWDPTEIHIQAQEAHPLGAHIQAHLLKQQGIDRLLDSLSLSCQEDVVILSADPEPHAEALSVCFPSGWDPREKLGEGFASIHQPVADHDRLLRASDNMMRAILHRGPFIRFSWGLTLSPHLNAHPSQPRPQWDPAWETEVAERVYLRMERQTTLKLPQHRRALFTIRLYVNSLKDTFQRSPELRPRLLKLLTSVKPEVLEYKGMKGFSEAVKQYLESHN